MNDHFENQFVYNMQPYFQLNLRILEKHESTDIGTLLLMSLLPLLFLSRLNKHFSIER